MGNDTVGLPIGWEPLQGIESPVDVFGGYLLLDAWIGNTDRHHENWALIVDAVRGRRWLAPTYDHASSLGAHEQDDTRLRRLESPDPTFRVEGYVQRADARSALFARTGEAKPLRMIEAFQAWSVQGHYRPWLGRLESVQEEAIEELIGRIPESEMSGPARAFARAILRANRRRILGVA